MLYLALRALWFVVLTVDFVIFTLVMFLCAWLPLCLSRRFVHRLFQSWCFSFIRFLGVEYHIHHKFSDPLPTRYVLISNHPSGFDILMLNALFPVRPLGKEEIKQWWVLGRIARAIGTVFVKREERQSRKAAKQSLIACVNGGHELLIYPEGGCFGKYLRPFKYGAFDIAIATGAPILPVYLQYEAENSFEWGDYGLIRHIWLMLHAPNKHVHCYIFNPISPEPFSDPELFTAYVHQLYERWEAKYRLP